MNSAPGAAAERRKMLLQGMRSGKQAGKERAPERILWRYLAGDMITRA